VIDDEQLERLLRARPMTDAAYQPVIADLLDAPRGGQPVVGSLRWRHGSPGLERTLALILVGAAILLTAAIVFIGGSRPDRLGVLESPSPAPTTVTPGAAPNFPASALTDLLIRFKASRWPATPKVVLDMAVAHDERIWFAASAPNQNGYQYATGELWPGNTVVRVGGVARLMLAALALQLVDEGRLDLGAPVSQYVPSWPEGGNITVRDLLAGSSGVASFGEPVEDLARLVAADPSRIWTAADGLRLARDKSPRFQPGARHEASDTEDALLVEVIESVTGSTVWDVFTQGIFGPTFSPRLSSLDVVTSGDLPFPSFPPYPPLPVLEPHRGVWDTAGALVEVADLPAEVRAVLGPARVMAFPVGDLARLTDAIHRDPSLMSGAARATLDKSFEDGGFGGSAMCPCSGDARNGVGLVGHSGPYTALAVYVPSERLNVALVANVAISDDDLQGLLQEVHDLVWPAIR
jgi:CubicO group peptidase (beta-lactamase class C family)